jgi:hypothetical protein
VQLTLTWNSARGARGRTLSTNISLQRTFTRAGEGFRATADEMLVADYIASDLRCRGGQHHAGGDNLLPPTAMWPRISPFASIQDLPVKETARTRPPSP